MKLVGFVVVLVSVFVLGSYVLETREDKGSAIPKSYQTMDELETRGVYDKGYTFEKISGQGISLDDYQGKVIILSFWATWCPPCVDEFPSLIQLVDKFPDKVVLFAVSHDSNVKDVENFINAFGGWRDNLHVVFDKDKAVSKAFEVGILPEGYIFDTKGKLVKKILGIQDWATPEAIEYFKSLE